MTSNDREILIAIVDGQAQILREQRALRQEISGLKADMQVVKQEVSDLKAEVQVIERDIAAAQRGLSDLKDYMYWILAAIGIFLAVIARLNRGRKSEPEKVTPPVINNIPPAVDISALAQQVEELLRPKLKTKE